MCGIYFSLSTRGPIPPSKHLRETLCERGPDYHGEQCIELHGTKDTSPLYLNFTSTVLSLRGDQLQTQPLVDDEGSIFCWNGEAWKIGDAEITGNDTHVVFDLLRDASMRCSILPNSAGLDRTLPPYDIKPLLQAMNTIAGPFAFVYYDAHMRTVLYGRDCLGRRSLLWKRTKEGDFLLSSICDGSSSEEWQEVEADGLYIVDLSADPQAGISERPGVKISSPDEYPIVHHFAWSNEDVTEGVNSSCLVSVAALKASRKS